jgi:putative serine/threonine protein kinase
MLFEEFKKLKKLQKFAEGYRGVIYLYKEKGQLFAVKTVEESTLLKGLQKEIEILKFLNKKGVSFVPSLVYIGEDFFVYKFIEGKPFKEILKEKNPLIPYYLKKILIASYCLDKLGVFKDEFQRPWTNVLVQNKKIFLIDFERGMLGKYYKNLPQFLQFLKAIKIIDTSTAILLGRNYRKSPKEVVKQTLKIISNNSYNFSI